MSFCLLFARVQQQMDLKGLPPTYQDASATAPLTVCAISQTASTKASPMVKKDVLQLFRVAGW